MNPTISPCPEKSSDNGEVNVAILYFTQAYGDRRAAIRIPDAAIEAATLGERVRESASGGAGSARRRSPASASRRSTSARSSAARRGRRRRRSSWLAERLGVDREFLETGVSATERLRVESVDRAGRGRDRGQRVRRRGQRSSPGSTAPTPELRASRAARRVLGTDVPGRDPRGARAARTGPGGRRDAGASPTLDRAEVLYRLGCCRYKLSSISTALALFDRGARARRALGAPVRPPPRAHPRVALALLPAPARLRGRRARTSSGRSSSPRASDDAETVAHVYFQASLVAERQGHWVLARSYAERRRRSTRRSRTARASAGCSTTSAASRSCSAGPSRPSSYLKSAFSHGARGRQRRRTPPRRSRRSRRSTCARARSSSPRSRPATRSSCSTGGSTSSTRSGTPSSCSAGRSSSRAGSTRPRPCSARRSAASSSSPPSSHRAAAWIAQGDLATQRGDDRAAARLYRRAAEALQDFRF